jgi:intracellular sulfur oxidation DsrE/DsrF family protein
MRYRKQLLTGMAIILHCVVITQLYGQKKIEGPVVMEYGQTFEISNPDVVLNINEPIKIIFDITGMSEDPLEVSAQINTIARCINMHVHAGMKPEDIHLSAVFHSGGTYSILKNEAYSRRFGTDNPNLALIDQLADLNVNLYVCGQSLYSRGVAISDLNENIKVALSAMTVLSRHQMDGFGLIKM